MRKYLSLLLCIPKSLYFNLRYFPILTAIRFPVLVRGIILRKVNGSVIIEGKIFPGMIRIGFGDVAIIDRNRARSIWQVSGKVIFKGIARLDHGTAVSVMENGSLTFGKCFNSTANCSIISNKSIEFGDDCLVSWDTLIMDTDFHKVKNFNGEIINHDEPIVIGNKVWIGCRATVLKGSHIPDSVVIAAGSVVSKSIIEQNVIIGGNPIHIIKSSISWDC